MATGTGNDFVVTDAEQYNKMIQALTGCSNYENADELALSNVASAVISGSALLNVVKVKTGYEIIACYSDGLFSDFDSPEWVIKNGKLSSFSTITMMKLVLLFRMLNKNIALLENPPLEEKGVCFN